MLLNLKDNPIIRMLAVLIAVAAGIRMIFWLLRPAMPYLVVLLLAFAIVKVVHWHRNRW